MRVGEESLKSFITVEIIFIIVICGISRIDAVFEFVWPFVLETHGAVSVLFSIKALLTILIAVNIFST